jgi:hypothetical protein
VGTPCSFRAKESMNLRSILGKNALLSCPNNAVERKQK